MFCRSACRVCTTPKVSPPLLRGYSAGSLDSPTTTIKQRVLSGIQPTGKLHIGNYSGALKQWVDNQHKYDNYFCVVDLHAITNGHDKDKLRRETLEAAAMYIAAGIDPKESCIFVQSHVPAHAELTWLLNCVTPISWLERMVQFKEKSSKRLGEEGGGGGGGLGGGQDSVSVGLFDYPVLMAADILLYQAELVPVGEDQRQHLELARDICRRFNDQYPLLVPPPQPPPRPAASLLSTTDSQVTRVAESLTSSSSSSSNKERKKPKNSSSKSKFQETSRVFREPEALVLQSGARVMSLQDGTSKMSKSHDADGSRINMLDSAEVIVSKIKRCKTDTIAGEMKFNDPCRPECSNLLSIYQSMTGGRSQVDIEREVAGMQWGQFKPLLAEAIVEHLAPIQREYWAIMQDEGYLEQVLKEGRIKAAATADHTLLHTKQALGFYLPPE